MRFFTPSAPRVRPRRAKSTLRPAFFLIFNAENDACYALFLYLCTREKALAHTTCVGGGAPDVGLQPGQACPRGQVSS